MLSTPIIRAVHRLRYRPEARSIPADVDYALQQAQTHFAVAQGLGIDISRASILELGPGLSFAPQLAFAGHGARVAVADRFLARWHPDYHPEFYRQFRARWHGPVAALDKVIAADGYPPDLITCVDRPAEQLSDLPGERFDLIISNAVLEHVTDLPAVARALAALTRTGGANSHQIDFGDHLNRVSPLEFLTRGDVGFLLENFRHPSQGNRRRLSECVAAFERAGFAIERTEANGFAADAYLEAFLPRLRNSRSRYRDWSADDLRVLGARICFRRS